MMGKPIESDGKNDGNHGDVFQFGLEAMWKRPNVGKTMGNEAKKQPLPVPCLWQMLER